jgi:hypothetical protein
MQCLTENGITFSGWPIKTDPSVIEIRIESQIDPAMVCADPTEIRVWRIVRGGDRGVRAAGLAAPSR